MVLSECLVETELCSDGDGRQTRRQVKAADGRYGNADTPRRQGDWRGPMGAQRMSLFSMSKCSQRAMPGTADV